MNLRDASTSDLCAERDRLSQMMFAALRLGFDDDVRHWKRERELVAAELFNRRRSGGSSPS